MTGRRLVRLAAATHRGVVRSANQDVVLVDGWASGGEDTRYRTATLDLDRPVAVAVIDGMGGYRGGELAAWLTAHVLAGGLAAVGDDSAADALAQHAHELVSDAGAGVGMPEMGAAFAALVLDPGGFGVLNVGDCRAYRQSEGALGLLSVDDAAPSRQDPTRTVLTQSVGGGDPRRIDAHWFGAPWSAGGTQRFLLASDGLAVVSNADVARLLAEGGPAESAGALVSATLAAGAPDNVSVVVAEVSSES